MQLVASISSGFHCVAIYTDTLQWWFNCNLPQQQAAQAVILLFVFKFKMWQPFNKASLVLCLQTCCIRLAFFVLSSYRTQWLTCFASLQRVGACSSAFCFWIGERVRAGPSSSTGWQKCLWHLIQALLLVPSLWKAPGQLLVMSQMSVPAWQGPVGHLEPVQFLSLLHCSFCFLYLKF